MTVNQLIENLTKLKEAGHGDLEARVWIIAPPESRKEGDSCPVTEATVDTLGPTWEGTKAVYIDYGDPTLPNLRSWDAPTDNGPIAV